MHLYTGLQALLLGAVWAVKESPGALALPFVIILLIPFRYFILPRFFTTAEIKAVSNPLLSIRTRLLNEKVSVMEGLFLLI